MFMNVEQIKTTSRLKYLHTLAKETASEKYLAKLTIPFNGGMWRVSIEMISFLKFQTKKDSVILLDIYQNPVKVDRKQMLDICERTYHEVMEEWFLEIEEINKQR